MHPVEMGKIHEEWKCGEMIHAGRTALDWRPAFLSSFALSGVNTKAAKAAKVSMVTVWRERRDSPGFASAYEEARQAGASTLETEARRRAFDGVRRLRFYEGSVIMVPDPSGAMQTDADGAHIVDGFGRPLPAMIPYVEHEYSDSLLTLLLKRHFPLDYRDNVKHDVSGEVTHRVLRLPPKEPAE